MMEQIVKINSNVADIDKAKAGILHMLAVRHSRIQFDPNTSKNPGITTPNFAHHLQKEKIKQAFLDLAVADDKDTKIVNPYETPAEIIPAALARLEAEGLIKELDDNRMNITAKGMALTPYNDTKKVLEFFPKYGLPKIPENELPKKRTAMKAEGFGEKKPDKKGEGRDR